MAALQKVESIERGKTSIPRFEKLHDAPIWLNSFLSIFIPSCPLDLIDPAMVNFYLDKEIDLELQNGKQKKVRGKDIHEDATKFNKLYQLKIIRRQIIASSIIILATVLTICYLVNFNKGWGYKNNILTYKKFMILSAVLVVMTLMSFLFVKNLDIFELFNLNSGSKKNSTFTPLVKGSVLAAATLLVLR